MLLRKKVKENPIKGCLISLLTIVGLLIACFLFCTVMFQLNQAATTNSTDLFTLLFG
jgi:membrane protein insertase Oxa1/YidC/SpoIIIJ